MSRPGSWCPRLCHGFRKEREREHPEAMIGVSALVAPSPQFWSRRSLYFVGEDTSLKWEGRILGCRAILAAVTKKLTKSQLIREKDTHIAH